MRAIVALGLTGTMLVASAVASAETGPLTPGKSMNIRKVEIEAGGVLMVLGVAGVAAGIAIVANGQDKPAKPQ